MTDTTEPATHRALDIRIAAARHVGFTVWEGGEIVAALTSRAEAAQWIEERLGLVPGEREREARDIEATRAAFGNVEGFPRVTQTPRTEPPRRRGFFGGV